MTPSNDPSQQPHGDAEQIAKRAALLGHDIRNAVADILGGLMLADLGPLDPASRQQLQRVRSASEQLTRLSDEVLTLISGEAGSGAAPAAFNLARFLEEIEARWGAHAREKGLRFALERSADLPVMIGTDRGALERILANLIGNAMKHTAAGEVTLCVGMRPRETLSLTVRDTGPGFSDAAMARLFEAGGRPAQSDKPGSGLGLHIVHDLAVRIGGRMHVGNRSLGGAEVAIRLPRPAWAPGAAGAETEALPDLSGFCVLVAEDNKTNQLLVGQMLESLGAECRIAADGEAALALLDGEHFNLALIDIEMPRLSGLDLIRTLRAREAASGAEPLPVLAITAYVLNANRDEIYEAGADGILAKPIMSHEAFGGAIAAVLKKRRSRAAALPRPGAGDGGGPLNNMHLDRLLALAGDENERELLSRLGQDFRTVLDGVQTGLSAPDFALLRARTHVLISLAGAVGAEPLQCMAETLNDAAHNRDHSLTGAIGPKVVAELGAVITQLEDEFSMRFEAGAA